MLLLVTVKAQYVLPPPKQYDHPYKGKLTVLNLTEEQMQKNCGSCLGEAFPGRGKCTILLPGWLKGTDTYNQIKRHEIGHCNGWPPHNYGFPY